MKQKKKWLFELSVVNIMICFFSIIINIMGDQLSVCCLLPFWLDMIGTIFAAGVLGPLAGGLVGIVSGSISVVLSSTTFLYAIIHLVLGIMIGFFYQRDTNDLFQILYTAAIISLAAIVLSTPVNLVVHNGYVGNIWGDALFDMLTQNGNSRLFSSILGEALVDFPDKVISFFLASGIARLWKRYDRGAKEENS